MKVLSIHYKSQHLKRRFSFWDRIIIHARLIIHFLVWKLLHLIKISFIEGPVDEKPIFFSDNDLAQTGDWVLLDPMMTIYAPLDFDGLTNSQGPLLLTWINFNPSMDK